MSDEAQNISLAIERVVSFRVQCAKFHDALAGIDTDLIRRLRASLGDMIDVVDQILALTQDAPSEPTAPAPLRLQ